MVEEKEKEKDNPEEQEEVEEKPEQIEESSDWNEDENENASEQSRSSQEGPHFYFIEGFFYVSIAIIGDLCDAVWVTRFVFGPVTMMWLYFKGVDSVGKNVIAQLVEMIPAVGWLPISTIAAILTIWQTNSPESFKRRLGKVADVMEITKKIKK